MLVKSYAVRHNGGSAHDGRGKGIDVEKDKIGQRVRRARLKRDITQVQLAEAVGVTHATINRIERGHAKPSAETANGIADELRVDMKWLLFGDERHMNDADPWWKAGDE